MAFFKKLRKQTGESAEEDFPKMLREGTESLRLTILDKLAYTLEYQLPDDVIALLMRDSSERVRAATLEYLQWHSTPTHPDYLVAALQGTSYPLQRKAARHLSVVPSQRAAPLLRELFTNATEDNFKGELLRALATCDDGQNAPFLFEILTRQPESIWSEGAGYSLAEVAGSEWFEPLIQLLDSDSPTIVRGATHALIGIGDHRATLPLLARLARPPEDSQLSRSILAGLGKLGDPRAIEALITATQDERMFIQMEALIALGNFEGEQITQLLLDHLKNGDENIRPAAINALATRAGENIMEALLAGLQQETNPRLLTVYARALAKRGDTRAIAALEEMLQRTNDSHYSFPEAIAQLKSGGRH